MNQIASAIIRIFPDEDARAPIVAITLCVALFAAAMVVKIICQHAETRYAIDRGYTQVVDAVTGQVLWVKP